VALSSFSLQPGLPSASRRCRGIAGAPPPEWRCARRRFSDIPCTRLRTQCCPLTPLLTASTPFGSQQAAFRDCRCPISPT
jgi:hypothetical protein